MTRRTLLAVAAALAAGAAPAPAQEYPFRLEGLVVTASPTPRAAGEVARTVTVLEGEDLRAAGHALVSDALRTVPGLSVVRGGSFGAVTSVFLRGGESDHVQVLVDGVQVNQPGGAFDFAGLTLDNVERIEIVRGPLSSLYGSDAMAGVIHVITRAGRGAPRLEASLRAGSFSRREGSVSVHGGGEDAGWSFSLARLRSDGVLPLNNGFENTVLGGSVRLAPDAATRAGVAVRLAERRYRFPTDGSGAVVDENAFTFGDEASVSLTASRVLSALASVQAGMTLAQSDGGTDDQADSPADTLGSFGFTSLDHVRRATADVRLHLSRGGAVATVGVEVEAQEQRSFSESLSEWGPSAGRSEYARDNRAGYAHVAGERGPISFAAGVRLEDNERFGSFGSWDVEAAWNAGRSTRVRATAGRGVKEPTFFENFARGWVTGNPDLRPEQSRSLEVGVEQSLAGDRVHLRGVWFDQRFRDLIQYVSPAPSPGAPNYLNVAGASASGIELGASARSGGVRVGADWSWLRTRVEEAGGSGGEGDDFVPGSRLLRRPAHTFSAQASYARRGATVDARVRVVGARDDRDFSTWPARRLQLPRYTSLDLGLEAPLGSVRLNLRAENLLDARYEEIAGFPAPGRGLYLGARVAFGG